MILVGFVDIAIADPARYVGRLQNGALIEGDSLSDWHSVDTLPKLNSQPLLDPSNPMRWLIDRSFPPPVPSDQPFIEFTSGDRLPGRVVGFRSGQESPFDRLPAHLLVQYDGVRTASLEPEPVSLRIGVKWVRRIVWENSSNKQVESRTVICRDGTEYRFRSIRFSADGLSLLLESGIKRLTFEELAQVVLDMPVFWPQYMDELAVLAGNGSQRLLQVETTSGLIATTSLGRLLPRVVGDAQDVNRWVHGIQPAWSLDVIWVPQANVWARRSFAVHEIPLPRLPVKRFSQRSLIGDVHFPLAVNRNVNLGPIRSATREAGWGLGVHAMAEIEYELPPLARSLRTEFAIDATMNDGGCVAARIFNPVDQATMYQSPTLVGAANIVDTGPLALNASSETNKRVVLQVDPVIDNRPSGADPFDIRDHANWIDPLVELDPSATQQRVEERSLQINSGLQGWQFLPEPGAQWRLFQFYAESPTMGGQFHPAISVTNNSLKATWNQQLSDMHRWLVIDVTRTQAPGPPAKLAIVIGSATPKEYDLPTYDKSQSDLRPIVVSLNDARAQNLPATLIEIRQLPTPESVPILWRSVAITDEHPLLQRLFEDKPPVRRDEGAKAEESKSRMDDQVKFFGSHSLVVSTGGTITLSLGRTISVRERPRLGEHRFLRFAVRKAGGGGLRLSLVGPTRQATYEAGPMAASNTSTRRLTTDPIQEGWILFTRDVYSDFGAIELDALRFDVPDGQSLWIDHVYLARTQNDFELTKTPEFEEE